MPSRVIHLVPVLFKPYFVLNPVPYPARSVRHLVLPVLLGLRFVQAACLEVRRVFYSRCWIPNNLFRETVRVYQRQKTVCHSQHCSQVAHIIMHPELYMPKTVRKSAEKSVEAVGLSVQENSIF